MSYPADTFSFGSADYRIVVDRLQLHTPIPRAQKVAEWVHVPYGSRNKREVDGGKLHTAWRVRIVLPTAADYTTLAGYYDSDTARQLVTPFGTIAGAYLAEMPDMQYEPATGSYQGAVTWEWA